MFSRLDESTLFKMLAETDLGLAESVKGSWDAAEPLLRHAAATNPTFTSHGPDHALAVVNILDSAVEPLLPILRPTSDEL